MMIFLIKTMTHANLLGGIRKASFSSHSLKAADALRFLGSLPSFFFMSHSRVSFNLYFPMLVFFFLKNKEFLCEYELLHSPTETGYLGHVKDATLHRTSI